MNMFGVPKYTVNKARGPGLGPSMQPVGGHYMAWLSIVRGQPDMKFTGPHRARARAGPGGPNGIYTPI
jgi:hypothetical protein